MASDASVAGRDAYVRMPDCEVPASHDRLDMLLKQAADTVPRREALVFPDMAGPKALRLDYASLSQVVASARRALLASGIGPGDTVAVYGANRPEFVFLLFACSSIGAAAVPVNPLYTVDELAYVLECSKARICFVDPAYGQADLRANLAAVKAGLPDLRAVVTLADPLDGFGGWWSWVSACMLSPSYFERDAPDPGPEAVSLILFTSGTTGRPKAVQLTGAALANVGRCTARRADLEDGCRYLHAMPFFHVGGTVTAMASCLAVKGTHIFLPSFSATRLAAQIARERATAILAVPTMMISLAERAAADGLSFDSLKTVLTGGALVPEAVARRWIDNWGVGISNVYGMTETAGPATQTSPHDPLARSLESVGRPLPGVEIEVVKVGTCERVALGAEGEIRFRSKWLMKGYLGDSVATSNAIDESGWMRSGDLGILDEDGFVRVTGRAKDLIIRGGENIAPSEIEDVIRDCVSELIDVAVVGVPDDYYGEVVAAFLRLRPGNQASRADLEACIKSRLSSHKMPAHWCVLEQFPATQSGKVQKFRLIEMFKSGKGETL